MKGILPLLLILTAAEAGIPEQSFVEGCRREVMGRARKNKLLIDSPIERNDLAEELVDEPEKLVKSPLEMEKRELLSGHSREIPWSDSYWPIYRGGLAQRYNDPDYLAYDWQEARDYVRQHPTAGLVAENSLELLSPAEKYDLLLGLEEYPLTASQWAVGEGFFRRSGRVESWMGSCHGWAPASMMMPEPKKKIVIGKIPFHPSDIKGLATLLWAKGSFSTRFIGGRCNLQRPPTDSQGRATDQNCLDNNPGSWHQVVVNQLGISKRPFIMDASSDYQVWNHPVYAYDYVYFNPRTGMAGSYAEAAEKSGSWDKRKSVRSPETKFIIGVRMNVSYAVENEPSTEEDQPRESSSAKYIYDLELNGRGEIIGGEWHSEGHPDFLWVPVPGAVPRTQGDRLPVNLATVSSELRNAARADAVRGLPEGNVVRTLMERSFRDE